MKEANRLVGEELGSDVVEVQLVDGVAQSTDFYLEDTAEVIEVELSLGNPYPCLEKDAFKLLVAKDQGRRVDTLILIGDPGSAKRLSAPTKALIDHLARRHALTVVVRELCH